MTMSSIITEEHRHHQHVLVTNATDENNISVVYDCVPEPPAELVVEKEHVKPLSFIDILKVNPNLEFEAHKKKEMMKPPIRKNIANIISHAPAGNNNNLDAEDGAAERFWAAKSTKDTIQQRLDFKKAACDAAKHVYEAAVSDEHALKSLLAAKNVKLSEAQSELDGFKSSGGAVPTTFIHDALRSFGIGISDLDWTELVDELLKPMKMEVVSLKENLREAQVTTKTSKKYHDKRTEELEVLKVQLKEAEAVFQEANTEFMNSQDKDITEENEDMTVNKEDNDRVKDAPDLPCVWQMELDGKVNETWKEDVSTHSEKTLRARRRCMQIRRRIKQKGLVKVTWSRSQRKK